MTNINHFFYLSNNKLNEFSNHKKVNDNFGDGVNRIFFEKLLHKKINILDRNDYNLFIHYFTTGSILHLVNENSIVYGSGFISKESDLGNGYFTNKGNSIVHKKPFKIISVRGPKTRAKLISMGIDCPPNYGDPLILFPLIYYKNIAPTVKYGIIPHYVDKKSKNLNTLVTNLGINDTIVIDIMLPLSKVVCDRDLPLSKVVCDRDLPLSKVACDRDLPDLNYKKFINQILNCEYIIASSLHAVIMGIIYRKKTIFVQFGKEVFGDTFKFFDFFESLDIHYTVKNIYTKELLDNVIQVDYDKLYKLVKNMINIAPFIEPSDKPKLIKRYKSIIYNQ
jgi:pyruvyltransferase